MSHLDKERREEENRSKQLKRKQQDEELNDLRAKRLKLEGDIKSLTKCADDMCIEAEKTGKFRELCIKSNALREKASSKKVELNKMNSLIKDKEADL